MVPQCPVKMPGFTSFASTLSGLLYSATVPEEEKSHNNAWPRNYPNGNYWRSRKHKACRPNAYGMLLAGAYAAQDKCGGESSNSDINEHDLIAMVEDFIENWNSKHEISSDPNLHQKGNIANAKISQLSENLQVMVSEISAEERDIQRYVAGLLLLVEEKCLKRVCSGEICNGDCIRQHLVKRLKRAGYNAALCKVKWQSCGRVPGGEYRYIDVILKAQAPVSVSSSVVRIIIDTDFRSQFQIARPTAKYQAALKILPAIYIGQPDGLMKIVQIMSEAAEQSLENMSMPVPPWRTFEYMKAKWFSPHERINLHQKSHLSSLPPCCSEQLTHLKTSLKEETPTTTTSLMNMTSNCRSKSNTGCNNILLNRS